MLKDFRFHLDCDGWNWMGFDEVFTFLNSFGYKMFMFEEMRNVSE